METTVNQRVIQLKTELGMGNNEFAHKAGISAGTVWSIQNGTEMKPRTIKCLCEAFNINKEWLLTGKGKMFAEVLKQAPQLSENPYKDALVSELKEQVEFLKEMLRGKIEKLPPSFLRILAKKEPEVYNGLLKSAA